MKRIAVIGGGAAGIAAAITAAENGSEVTVYEKNDRVGRKLLSTGNGRCNLSNVDRDLSHFHGDKAFISEILGKADVDEFHRLLHNILFQILDLFADLFDLRLHIHHDAGDVQILTL